MKKIQFYNLNLKFNIKSAISNKKNTNHNISEKCIGVIYHDIYTPSYHTFLQITLISFSFASSEISVNIQSSTNYIIKFIH